MMVARTYYFNNEVDTQPDVWDVFKDLRHDVEHAPSTKVLNELYKRAGYLLTLTRTSAWERRYGLEAAALRKLAEAEFALTARKINRRAQAIGVEANYREKWG
jgi:hypothetical protein